MPCWRSRRSFSAWRSSLVRTMPPSPVVITLRGWNEKQTSGECPPIGRPLCREPRAQAASSTTATPCRFAIAPIRSRSAGSPI